MHRRNRASLKRIGLLAFAMVIALGAMGVGYAAWTDSVYINSTVYTGTLDIDIWATSSTFVYKEPGMYDPLYGNDIVVRYVDGSSDSYLNSHPEAELIASAVTTFNNGGDADLATMTFDGLFPCIDFQADLYLEYNGTIPGIIEVAIVNPDNDAGPDKATKDAIIAELWNLGQNGDPGKGIPPRTYGAWFVGKKSTNYGVDWVGVDAPEGIQLHRYDFAHVILHVHIPQDPAYENLSGLKFEGVINVIQWNEYEEPT